MGFTILLDVAILVAFAVGALLAQARSTRLGCAVALLGLASLDLASQIWASSLDRDILTSIYPMLYPSMLVKNLLLLGVAVYALVRALEFGQESQVHPVAEDLAHPAT